MPKIVIDKESLTNMLKVTIYAITGDDYDKIGEVVSDLLEKMDYVELSKGHGRLIDADKFSERLMNSSLYFRGETADIFDTRFADGLKTADEKLVDAPTIIEADKE